MIDARELRIGNWVKYTTGEEGKVISITEYGAAITLDMEYMGADYYDPIPLTPEILKECGFIKVKKTEYYIVSNKDAGTILIVNVIDNEYSLSCFPVVFQYLHQLQNLYYSLTNTELNFKP